MKKLDIWAIPDVLIIRLNRVELTQRHGCMFKQKNERLISFPVHGLDLTEFVKGPIPLNAPPIYDLYAMTDHSGSAYSGHNLAYCKNYKNQHWYVFDDIKVSYCEVEEVVQSNAYILFYRRRTGSCRWGGAWNL